MEKIFLGIAIFAFVIFLILAVLLLKVSSNVGRNARELKTTLEKIQTTYSPLGVVVSFFKFLLSLFT